MRLTQSGLRGCKAALRDFGPKAEFGPASEFQNQAPDLQCCLTGLFAKVVFGKSEKCRKAAFCSRSPVLEIRNPTQAQLEPKLGFGVSKPGNAISRPGFDKQSLPHLGLKLPFALPKPGFGVFSGKRFLGGWAPHFRSCPPCSPILGFAVVRLGFEESAVHGHRVSFVFVTQPQIPEPQPPPSPNPRTLPSSKTKTSNTGAPKAQIS